MKGEKQNGEKPFFRPAKDDTKPLLQDPILRSDPIETEEAVLRLPPLPDCIKSKSRPYPTSGGTLLESSGDSEAEYFQAEPITAVEDDDAQSCSCGSLVDQADIDGCDLEEEDEEGGVCACEEEVEDGVVNQCCCGQVVVPAAEERLDQSRAELTNEREADRLFWEACLAPHQTS